jgi:tRNA(Arg) A34 adenosine deaminase TadA
VSSRPSITLSHVDVRHLRRAFWLARQARAAGNNPFGCLLVAEDDEVLMEHQNQALAPIPVRTTHAETDLAREAASVYTPQELLSCTLYSSVEPCAMCAGAIYWAGIGRVVFGMTQHELKDLTSEHLRLPTLDLPCREVFARGQFQVEVLGPALAEEARAVHDGFWSSPAPRRFSNSPAT